MLRRGSQLTTSGSIHRLHPSHFPPTGYRSCHLPLGTCSIRLSGIVYPRFAGTRPTSLPSRAIPILRYSTTVTNPAAPPPDIPPGTSDSNAPPPPPPPPRSRIRPILTTLFFLTAGAYILFLPSWHSHSNPNLPLHPKIFQPWILVAREPCGDTTSGASAKSAIFVLRPKPIEGKGKRDEKGSEWDEFWKRGVWSVEVKQPELMVSRRYTPLPDLSRVLPVSYSGTTWSGSLSAAGEGGVDGQGEDGGEAAGELKFYIKEKDGGEVSRWLFGLPVGTEVWLRGPRFEWEYPWHQSEEKEQDHIGDEGRVITFLAGGTGISPALQTAASFFEPENIRSLMGRKSSTTNINITTPLSSQDKDDLGNAIIPIPEPKTNYNILWAVRTPEDLTLPIIHELALLSNLATHAEIGFSVTPHVDSLNEYITPEDIENTIAHPPKMLAPYSKSSSTSWIGWLGSFLPGGGRDSHKKEKAVETTTRLHESISDRDPRDRYILVSGPDGFMSHFAGEKGPDGDSQGKVGGVVKEVVRRGRELEKAILEDMRPGKEEKEKRKEEGKEKDLEVARRVRWFVWKL